MSKPKEDTPEDTSIKAQVSGELEKAKQFAKSLNFDSVKSGEWFIHLLMMVAKSYDRNATAKYFQKKYPGLPPDEIGDKLISVTTRWATVAGAIAGAAATADQIVTIGSGGMTAALFVGTIGAEMIYLARIQMRLLLDLSVVYDLQLDPEDPEDVLMVFGYALGVAPTEAIGKVAQHSAGAVTAGVVKKYISKSTLKAVQDFAKKIGFKILQRTIIKYAVPAASMAVGSSYNYVTTKSVGQIAKAHFRNRGKVTDELRKLVSRQNTYDLAFPAAAMYLARADGQVSNKEMEFYRGLLSRMSFDEHDQDEVQRLMKADTKTILEAITKIEDIEIRRSLVDVLVLMAVYDGELAEKERQFLTNAAQGLGIPLDMNEVEQRTEEYRVIVKKNIFEKTAGVVGGAAVSAVGVAGHAAGNVKGAAVEAGSRAKNMMGKVFQRKKETKPEEPASEGLTMTCSNCGREISTEFQFCPGCGQSMAKEKACSSCSKLIPIDFAFCPHCGVSQG